MNNRAPKSFFEETAGMIYFARMLDKIRLFAKGELREDCHDSMGAVGRTDWLMCNYLRVDYTTLRERVLAGGTDGEILEWCFAHGRHLDTHDILIWNDFIRKRGWNDPANARLVAWKAESGHAERDDLQTLPDYTEVLEGRRP